MRKNGVENFRETQLIIFEICTSRRAVKMNREQFTLEKRLFTMF